MNELISSLGIDMKLFGAQLINFAILLFVLYKFAYKPVLKMLDDRTEKIEKGLKDAEASSKKLEEMTEREKEILVEAKKQAKEIIEKAEEQARINRDEIVAHAKEESDRIIENAQNIAQEQKQKMIGEVKLEVADLVAVALEKVVDEKMNAEKDVAIINEVLNIK
ncbi:MAG: ATP synthase F0 subunit B [Candidatus Moraniibacteriota bacterium]|nr:MAG: ATP synthase F0 subunit B [Candidatus Moranbacteria bacterium]